MRLLIATFGIVLGLAVGAPAALAQSHPSTSRIAVLGPPTGDGLPEWHVTTLTARPPGLRTTAAQAIAAAKSTATMQSLHRREHPLVVVPLVWEFRRWMVDFYYQDRLVAEAEVTGAGHVTGVYTGPVAIAVYARGHFLPLFDSWWVVGAFSLLFLLPFLALRRLGCMAFLDALAVLSFLVSYGLFNSVHLETGVWLAYPPLLYLAVRMAWIGFGRSRGRGRGRERQGPLVPNRVLGLGLLALVAARMILAVVSHDVSDVGVASAVGAHRILDGLPLYYAGAQHADTYGPIAYLAYVPFDSVLSMQWAAKATAIAFDVVTIVGLLALGVRLRPGQRGRRLGLLLAWGWAACPFTLLALMMHTNDGLIAMLSVLALLAFASPAARGAMLGLAAAAKFSPAILLPLFASPRDRGRKATLACVGAFALVVIAAIGLYLPSGGLREFYDHTIGYQLSRTDVFSPWALHTSLKPIATAIEALVILLAATVAFVPRRRSLAQVSALAAMLTIAVQLPAIHWFYYYIVWFMPFLLVALLAPPRSGAQVGEAEPADASPAPEPQERILVPRLTATMPTLVSIPFAAVGGLIVGSFLNVVAYRLPRGESLMWPASRCPSCGTPVKAYDNVPVLGWLMLRGRCRSCQDRISGRYPVVEATCAALAVLVLVTKHSAHDIVLGLILIAVLVPVALIDLDIRIIPNRITLPAAIAAVIAGALTRPSGLPEQLIAGAAAGGFLLVFVLAYPRGMGMGDVKLAGVLGLFLGRSVAVAILSGTLIGALAGAIVMARLGVGAGRKTAVPFGPFLALGGLIALFAGPAITHWYLHSVV